MNKTTLYRGLVVVGFLVVLVWVAPYASHESSTDTAQNTLLEQSYWHSRIIAVGGGSAYTEFGTAVAPLSVQDQHTAAHAFGGALFDVEGEKGLSVCDSNFNFGCYHEFLGRSISTLGLSVVTSLNQGCVDVLGKQSLSCQHGIGHGVLSYLGYTKEALLKGLEQCESLPFNDPIGGCYGGLFMEYNLQTMLRFEGRIRPQGENPHEPCDELDAKYRRACYYWQAQWWAQTFKPIDRETVFAQMGEWCLAAGQNIRDCFEGIGNITSSESGFNPAVARTLCQVTSGNARYQLYCKSVAANSLGVVGGGKKGDGVAICQDLDAENYEYCAAYAQNRFNTLVPGILP